MQVERWAGAKKKGKLQWNHSHGRCGCCTSTCGHPLLEVLPDCGCKAAVAGCTSGTSARATSLRAGRCLGLGFLASPNRAPEHLAQRVMSSGRCTLTHLASMQIALARSTRSFRGYGSASLVQLGQWQDRAREVLGGHGCEGIAVFCPGVDRSF